MDGYGHIIIRCYIMLILNCTPAKEGTQTLEQSQVYSRVHCQGLPDI